MKKAKSLEEWEVSIIKAMQGNGYSQQDILSYFTRPGRSINIARLYEIKDGESFSQISPASDEKLKEFVQNPEDYVEFLDARSLENVSGDPFSRKRLGIIFPKNLEKLILPSDETDIIEYKSAFNWSSPEDYGKILSSFSNNKGGYLVFGVSPEGEFVGLKNSKFQEVDSAKISKFLNTHFVPQIMWKRKLFSKGKKKFGIIYASSASRKPIICCKDKGVTLKDGEIYFRYVGSSEKVRHAELAAIIEERVSRISDLWKDRVTRIAATGPEDSAIVDLKTGIAEGSGAIVNIDPVLLDQIRDLREKGETGDERKKPEVRLSGEIMDSRPIGLVEVPTAINDSDLIFSFLMREKVVNPIDYLRQSCHSATHVLPIFYYIWLAGISMKEAVRIVESEKTNYVACKKKIIRRITDGGAFGVRKSSSNDLFVEDLENKKISLNLNVPNSKKYLYAIRKMHKKSINNDFIFSSVCDLFQQFYFERKDIATFVRHAVCHMDTEIYMPQS